MRNEISQQSDVETKLRRCQNFRQSNAGIDNHNVTLFCVPHKIEFSFGQNDSRFTDLNYNLSGLASQIVHYLKNRSRKNKTQTSKQKPKLHLAIKIAC